MRQAVQEQPPITFGQKPGIQEGNDSAVGLGPDQPAHPLPELDQGLRQRQLVEGIATGFPDALGLGLGDRMVRRIKRQPRNDDLRQRSEAELNDTKVRYEKLIGVMKAAAGKMDPVLARFKDQVLFLKHNLNAAAIASLSTTAAGIDNDVSKLIKDMEASIAEADTFVNQMKTPAK